MVVSRNGEAQSGHLGSESFRVLGDFAWQAGVFHDKVKSLSNGKIMFYQLKISSNEANRSYLGSSSDYSGRKGVGEEIRSRTLSQQGHNFFRSGRVTTLTTPELAEKYSKTKWPGI